MVTEAKVDIAITHNNTLEQQYLSDSQGGMRKCSQGKAAKSSMNTDPNMVDYNGVGIS